MADDPHPLEALNARGLTAKREYVRGLEQRRDPEALSLLVECLCDESWFLRDLAEQTFVRMGEEHAGPLLPLLAGGLWYTRLSAARLLGRLGYRPAVPALLELCDDPNESTSIAARDALVAVARQRGAARLAHALRRIEPERRARRLAEIAERDRAVTKNLERLMADADLMSSEDPDRLVDPEDPGRAGEPGGTARPSPAPVRPPAPRARGAPAPVSAAPKPGTAPAPKRPATPRPPVAPKPPAAPKPVGSATPKAAESATPKPAAPPKPAEPATPKLPATPQPIKSATPGVESGAPTPAASPKPPALRATPAEGPAAPELELGFSAPAIPATPKSDGPVAAPGAAPAPPTSVPAPPAAAAPPSPAPPTSPPVPPTSAPAPPRPGEPPSGG